MNEREHPGYRLSEPPPPPTTASEGAKQEWEDIVPIIYQLRTGRPADLRLIELACEMLADVRGLEAVIRKEGYTVTSSGGPKPHPALRSLEIARRQAQQLLDKFGLAGSGGRKAPEYHGPSHKHKFG